MLIKSRYLTFSGGGYWEYDFFFSSKTFFNSVWIEINCQRNYRVLACILAVITGKDICCLLLAFDYSFQNLYLSDFTGFVKFRCLSKMYKLRKFKQIQLFQVQEKIMAWFSLSFLFLLLTDKSHNSHGHFVT